MQVVTCSKCGAVIARHEPLVIVDGEQARRSTLAIESHPPAKGSAIYHPACYERVAGQLPFSGGQRVFQRGAVRGWTEAREASPPSSRPPSWWGPAGA